MKKFKPLLLIALATFIYSVNMSAQLVCNSYVNVALSGDGSATIYPEIILEGNTNYDNLMISKDGVNFFPEVTYTCDDMGESEVTISAEINGSIVNCWGTVNIEDKLAPIAVVQDLTVQLNQGVVVVHPEDVDINSFDNCGIVSMDLSPNTFNQTGVYESVLTVTDGAGFTAQAVSEITVIGEGDNAPCNNNLNLSLNFVGSTIVWPDMVIEGSIDDMAEVLLSQDGVTFQDSIPLFCDDIGTNIIYVQIEYPDGNTTSCNTIVDLQDFVPPVAVVEIEITVYLINGVATITPADIDDGSYDACTDITYELSQSTFYASDLGENVVTLTVTDEFGNSNSAFTTVIVVDSENCGIENVNNPSPLIEVTSFMDPADLSPEVLEEAFGFSDEEVRPTWPSNCSGLFSTYEDVVLIGGPVDKILRTWTTLSWSTGEVLTFTQVIKIYPGGPLACTAELTVLVPTSGDVQLYPGDFLVGYNGPESNLTLQLTVNGIDLPDPVVNASYEGMQITYLVTETTTGNTCWGQLNVVVNEECEFSEDDILWPIEVITLENTLESPSVYTPSYLEDVLGYEFSDVNPTFETNCDLIGVNYQDTYTTTFDGTPVIFRNWLVINWYDPNVVYDFEQIIYLTTNTDLFICDILPRTAPLGDCDSGHTNEDDVEWPADLSIIDYRITPDDLVSFSGADPLDAQPSFYNEPSAYTATYVDFLAELTETSLTVARQWKVVRDDVNLTWFYTQDIAVDFSQFSNLVTVTTSTNRAVPGVVINNVSSTNEYGNALYADDDNLELSLFDENMNGANVLDAVLLNLHTLGVRPLNNMETLAADLDNNEIINSDDLEEFKFNYLGIAETFDWNFYEQEVEPAINSSRPRASFVAIKKGDIDDSALLGEDVYGTINNTFTFDDQLLNNGESYNVGFKFDEPLSVYGMDIRLDIDSDKFDVIGVSADWVNGDIPFAIVNQNELRILLLSNDIAEIGGENADPVFYVEIAAKTNSLLSLAINTDNYPSFVATSNLNYLIFGGDIEGTIGTGTNSPELNAISAYPNPTIDYLNFNIQDIDVDGDVRIEVLDITGQTIQQIKNAQRIDVRELSGGMYYYRLTIGEYNTTGKFLKIK